MVGMQRKIQTGSLKPCHNVSLSLFQGKLILLHLGMDNRPIKNHFITHPLPFWYELQSDHDP